MGKNKNIILSIKYGGHDTASALMIDGRLVAACEQERYTLDKHSRLFPTDAINDCLKIGGITMDDVDEIAFVNDLKYYIREIYLRPALENDDRIGFLIDDIGRLEKSYRMEELIRKETCFKGSITFHRHHLCHLASSYYPSGFDEALLLSYDGLGEKETAMIGIGKSGNIEVVHDKNYNPHSLGLLYSAITFYLGWRHHCDEGIIMGLAPFGDSSAVVPGSKRTYIDVFREILKETGDYDFEVDQSWMAYYRVRDIWVEKKFYDMFGSKRSYGEEITQHHKNIAAALQDRLEEVTLNQMRQARKQFGISRLCLAGGVALNCSNNGVILQSKIFDEIFVQPAAGDAGCTIGACYLAHAKKVGGIRPEKMHNFYTGSRFTDDEILEALEASDCSFEKPENIFEAVAKKIDEGFIIGWFQGGAEFGPRALGNRSILCRPYPEGMRDHINARVKFREEFRPFAPSVTAQRAEEFFIIGQSSPHMLMAVQVRPDKKDVIPAVVHIDDSCRVQTVTAQTNKRFYNLLKSFEAISDIPVILNTSFNVKGQPIVNTPKQAIDTYLSTNIDCLAVGDYLLVKEKS